MGKCISKDQQIKIREIDERSYIAISNDFDYYHYEDSQDDYDDFYENEGQSESKKSSSSSSKKMHGPETKGTSISFGFKKKNYSTANKKQQIIKANNNNNSINREKEEQAQKATIISNLNVITSEQNNFIIAGDNNGNINPAITTSSDEKEFIRTTSPAKLQPAKRDQHNAGKSNRFGFRQNVIRPSSTAITPKFNEFDNLNNNNSSVCRAKSATTTQLRSNIQSELKPAKSITEQHNINSTTVDGVEINANSLSNRPTSAASQNQTFVVSRYTLQSTSLPRPQYPVPVSVAPSTTYVRNSPAYSSLNTSSRPLHSVQSKLIDTKGAKHQANITKRGGMMMTRRDESLDSGIASHDSTSDNHPPTHRQQQHQQQASSQSQSMDNSVMRRSRRRFEMIPGPSRHKFEIRDLNDYNENAVIVPLSLPKLPTERREIVTNGLIRSTNSYTTDNETDMSVSEGSRPTSFISTASEIDSFEEEKLKIDTSCSEKSIKGAIAKESFKSNSKNSSPSSWRSNNNGGESMAMNVCNSVSISSSSSDDYRKNQKNTQSHEGGKIMFKKKDIDCDEDELSSMTITADHSSYFDSMASKNSPSKDQKETVNDAFLKQQQQASQQPKVMGSISRKELFIEVDEVKFAETVAATQNLALLDDETSPSESLVSSSNSESGELPMKKTIESKQIDEIKEEEELIDEVTPELVSPCSPTHVSNSLSFSDPGRDDFLIDDEIADQPALMISAKKQTGSHSRLDDHRSISMAMNVTSDCTTTTPTLKDISINSHGSLRSLNKLQAMKTIKSDQSSPAVNRKAIMERSGSLDTLSPCDSIASDDLMADFDLASSLDSIDRHGQSVDDLHVNSENEMRQISSGGYANDMKEYGAIFRSSAHQSVQRRHSNRENITSQLPARATRLLNRRLQNTNNSSPINNGSESPRSLDSMHSRTSATRASLREHLKQRQQQNIQSQLMNSSSEDLLADKSLRNSMLQDVSTFKKQLVQLRRILQEDEDKLMMSDTLNPFEINGQIFSHLNGSNANSLACENEKEMPNDDKEKKDDEKNVVLTNEQLMLLEDQRQELADLRRQVVFLQSQMDDKDRIIRQQQSRLDELRIDNMRLMSDKPSAQDLNSNITETANCATQTERLRPVSMGGVQDFNSHQEPHKSQKATDAKQPPTITIKPSPQRSKTQISSVYTKLSSIKPTAVTGNKSSSIPTSPSSKPMKSTKIEHPKTTPSRMQSAANVMRNNDLKSPLRRSIPQLVKTPNNATHSSVKIPAKSQKQATTAPSSLSLKAHRVDDSNGNSATSSLSTSSSNSSINDKHHNNNNSNHTDSNSIGFLAQQLNEIYSRGLLE